MGFLPKYDDEQRAAVAHAVNDLGIAPSLEVARRAGAGELTDADGLQVAPFTISDATVRKFAGQARKAAEEAATAARNPESALTDIGHRDAVEQLRRRLIANADTLLTAYEATLKADPATADPERLRQIGRVIREAAALPARDDPRPPAPGAKRDGHRDSGATRGGLAAEIMADVMEDGPASWAPPAALPPGSRDQPEPVAELSPVEALREALVAAGLPDPLAPHRPRDAPTSGGETPAVSGRDQFPYDRMPVEDTRSIDGGFIRRPRRQ